MRGRDIPACLKAGKVADGGRRLGWPKRILDGPRACVGMSVGAARRLVLPHRSDASISCPCFANHFK